MVPSPLLGLLPVTKTLPFVAVITYDVYLSTEEKMKNTHLGILKLLWHSVCLFINVKDVPDNRFLFICPQIFILN